MKVKTIGVLAGAAVATAVGITSISRQPEKEVGVEQKGLAVSTTRANVAAKGIETSFVIGHIQGWPIMIFVNEDADKISTTNRLESHISKGISRILSYNKISSPPSDCSLTLFTCADNGSGWNTAYPTAVEKQSATNAILNSLNVHTKDITGIPNECMVAIGWLCYVTNGFWNTHTSPVSFSDVSTLKGGWLYRER